MTTAAPEAPAATRKSIPVKSIVVRPQARKDFDDAGIKELSHSIGKIGIINPVTVRPADGGRFLLVAGERRLRAVKMLGKTEIDAYVRDLDDDEALELQTAENLHRKDLGPIEEARGLRFMMDKRKHTIDEMAKLVDKSTSYVARAVRLLELPKEVVGAIEDGKITPAHGHQLLRIPEAERAQAFVDWQGAYGENGNARSLQEHVDQTYGRDLERAAFPKGKPYAGAIACTACPSNSGNQGALFDGATKGKCLLKDCFDRKAKQAEIDQVVELKKSYPAAADVIKTKAYVYAGSAVEGDWIARGPFEKKIPKGRFALVVSAQDPDAVWIATRRTEAEAERQEAAAPKPEDPAVAAREKAIEEHLAVVIDAAVKKASSKQIAAAYRARWKKGWEQGWLKENGMSTDDLLACIFALEVNGRGFEDADLIKALEIDAKAEAKKAVAAIADAPAKK